ncbi:elongator complex protein 1-like isoform X2 [Telopea speciosissima]|uniref:elongator complex protein 1-like isoform X2 n=1 Tax=Telopea speciosissima TaxID=54955 RepID=UPI001CC3A1EC|nr:elongator complex protein 1-like isoform X2 [Telopea speciosissima]
MKNLQLSSEISFKLELQLEEEVLLFSAFDIERNRLFFVSSANVVYIRQLPLPQKGRLWNKNLLPMENDPVDLEPGDSITALDYLMEKEALLVGTSNGYLMLHAGDGSATEVVGRVEGGVKCIAPSPDGALIAIVTGFGKILVMTHDWDLLYEIMIDNQPTDVDVRDATGSTIYPFEISVSWRGDGKYFATLSESWDSSSSQKKLRIWERDSGALHSVTEAKAFMGAALDWMPSGAKVAAAFDRKADNNGPLIVFFERNGLERSSFSINELMDATIEVLKWNCSSDLLGAVVRCERYDAIKIWSFSNNHWYLKQEIRYPKSDRVKFIWDPMKPLHLISWTLGGKITTYNFVWITAVMENSVALVIDNSNVHVTPLALSLMPPPMYLFNLKFPTAVCDMAFFSKSSKSQMAACLSDGSLCIVEFPASDTWEELEGKEFFVETSSEVAFGSLKHLIWLDSHILLGVSYYETGDTNNACLVTSSSENELTHCQGKYLSGYSLQEIELVCSEDCVLGLVASSGWGAKVSCQLSLEGPVIAIVPNPAKRGSAFVQLDGGIIVEYTSKLGITRVPAESYLQKLDYSIGFSSSCPWMSIASVYDNGVLKPLPFGLDDNGSLHVSGRILCNNCSGFSFYSNSADQMITHLILTTKQDLLFIVDMDDILHGNLEAKYEKFIKVGNRNIEENRDSINIWERGAKLVGVLHGDAAAVILQTTRGNLECIHPRKLVLASIVNALVQRRFRDAILMVRRHRIDFNIIVDHCGWQNFLECANEFVKQVKNLSYITEFVCSVKNENVTEKLYRNIISLPYLKATRDIQAANVDGCYGKSKISSVLQAIREALEDQVPESPAKELCILTTLARSEPPAIVEALKRIKVVREMELLGVDDPRRKSYPSAEEAMKHLLWLTNSEAAYEAALGLYDLNLAAIVALNSQKDPKEFLPFLQGLERMPPLIMKYKIDLRLQRYESALKNIVSAGDAYYEDSINLMKNNPKLFSLGIQLFTDPSKKSQILEAWGDHLHGDKCFEDAATAYLCCSSLEKALKAYRACGHWKGVLTVAGLLKLGKEEALRLANELCEELQALGKPAEAAKIALEYCDDVASGIHFLISAREWEEALRIGFIHKREDLISEVKCAALECAGILISEYEEGLEKVGKYLARYLAVRQRRLLLSAKLQSEDRSIDDVDDETASNTSSNFSGMSAYTTGTRRGSSASTSSTTASKARQTRHQKKGGKIRAGSPGEEMALVEHLKGMSLTAGAQHELKSLLVSLVMLGNEETARKLQRVGDSFQLSQRAAVKLAEDTISNDDIDEKRHTLEHYVQKVRGELPHLEAIPWQSKVLFSS